MDKGIIDEAIRRLYIARGEASWTIRLAIFDEARRRKLDKMTVAGQACTCRRGGKIVDSKKIGKLLARYQAEIDPKGIHGVWTKEEGWSPT